MAQWVTVLAALTDNPVQFLALTGQFITICNFVLISVPSGMHVVHIHKRGGLTTHTHKMNLRENKTSFQMQLAAHIF